MFFERMAKRTEWRAGQYAQAGHRGNWEVVKISWVTGEEEAKKPFAERRQRRTQPSACRRQRRTPLQQHRRRQRQIRTGSALRHGGPHTQAPILSVGMRKKTSSSWALLVSPM